MARPAKVAEVGVENQPLNMAEELYKVASKRVVKSKFIQIAANHEAVIALDDVGDVWWFKYVPQLDKFMWVKATDERSE